MARARRPFFDVLDLQFRPKKTTANYIFLDERGVGQFEHPGTAFASLGGMKQKGVVGGLLIDFLVPASLASRYRARLTALSPAEAELRLSFCPSIFRSGAVTWCPAEISAVFGAAAVRVRGSFHLEGGSSCTTARFRFDPPIALRDLELLQQVGPDEAEPVSPSDSIVDEAALDSCPRESESTWLQTTTAH